MKKLILTVICTIAALSVDAQVTKADIEQMLTDQSSSMAKITSVYVTNRVVHYTDGTVKTKDATYESSNHNTFDLTTTGVRCKYNPPDKEGSTLFFPYASMKYIYVGATSISIHLMD